MTLKAFEGRCAHCGHDHGNPYDFELSARPVSSSGHDVQLGMLRDDVNRLRKLVMDLRWALSEIYALRGEDEEIARLCRQAIDTVERRA